MFIQAKRALRHSRFLVAIYQATLLRWRLYRDWNEKRSRQLVTTPYGFKLVAPTTDGNNAAMLRGEFESEEIEILRHHLAQADTFIDIGANVGLYVCLARQLGKEVIAVEPQRRNLESLYATLLANNWMDVEVIPMGVSDHAGLAKLFGETGPSASLIEGWADFSSDYSQLIPITTLDNLAGSRLVGKKAIIKIDVEGAEHFALLGAQQTLSTHPQPTWMVEICLDEFHPGGTNSNYAATFDLFWRAGYTACTAEREARHVTPADVRQWVKQNRCEYGVHNFVFTPR